MKAVNHLLALLFLLISPLLIQSQSLERYVTASAGEYFETSSLQISWTMGETVNESFVSNQSQLDQGFHQSIEDGIDLIENHGLAKPRLFPNPFIDKITITDIPEGTTSIVLLQADGKELKRIDTHNQKLVEFFWPEILEGSYIIQIINEDHQSTYKIVKTH